MNDIGLPVYVNDVTVNGVNLFNSLCIVLSKRSYLTKCINQKTIYLFKLVKYVNTVNHKKKVELRDYPIFFLSAILGRITDRHKKNDGSPAGTSVSGSVWIRFTLNVDFIYKKSSNSRIRRGDVFLYVHSADLACRCPKIKPNR